MNKLFVAIFIVNNLHASGLHYAIEAYIACRLVRCSDNNIQISLSAYVSSIEGAFDMYQKSANHRAVFARLTNHREGRLASDWLVAFNAPYSASDWSIGQKLASKTSAILKRSISISQNRPIGDEGGVA